MGTRQIEPDKGNTVEDDLSATSSAPVTEIELVLLLGFQGNSFVLRLQGYLFDMGAAFFTFLLYFSRMW